MTGSGAPRAPGNDTVYYTYDALGRLLKRTKGTGSTAETRVYYWLGLNKIAEEVWAAEAHRHQHRRPARQRIHHLALNQWLGGRRRPGREHHVLHLGQRPWPKSCI